MNNKIVLVGCGLVGTSFLYSAINQNLASEYALIDINEDVAQGNVWDLADANALMNNACFTITKGNWNDCDHADLIVITAGRSQQLGETRLAMVQDNATIMTDIAQHIKKTNFSGITIIVSNPVDILTFVYQKITQYDANKVIGSGTTLDSARLKRLLGDHFQVSSQAVHAFMIGEHGDHQVAVYSHAQVACKPLTEFVKDGTISQVQLDDIEQQTINMAYRIIEKKKSTFYGIGAALVKLATMILNNQRHVALVSVKLNGEYHQQGVYVSVPVILGANGCESIITLSLSASEADKFNQACIALKTMIESI